MSVFLRLAHCAVDYLLPEGEIETNGNDRNPYNRYSTKAFLSVEIVKFVPALSDAFIKWHCQPIIVNSIQPSFRTCVYSDCSQWLRTSSCQYSVLWLVRLHLSVTGDLFCGICTNGLPVLQNNVPISHNY